MGLLSFIFSSDNTRHLKKLNIIADQIEALSGEFGEKTDEELKVFTNVLKERLANNETLDDILPHAFALVREASTRVLKMRHFYVQLVGGIVLHQGRIAEMRTGEGKTLVATLAAYLNALTGKGVHIVTVNEYLATTQSEWMGRLFKFLGLSVGLVKSGMSPQQRQNAYKCDITYATNTELGFDYLRDNMAVRKEQHTQRGYEYAIIDEVDSILIDEARNPLILSGMGMKTGEMYEKAQRFFKTLTKEHYEVDEKLKATRLTEAGVEKAEKYFKVENLADINSMEINHHINNALKANIIMLSDVNYIVRDNEVLIVDEFTGRVMSGRRFSDGLHQAIEAKEGVKILDENKTLATTTLQNYFKLYKKISGMTGTAKTEEAEFNKIYTLDVVTIPTNKPVKRVDEQDFIFYTRQAKTDAIIEEIRQRYEKCQPILVGTVSIERSEEISKALRKVGIPHKVLNAKNHELESHIVAQAGRYKAVTIATNMAGRGTDILLGGNPEVCTKEQMMAKGVDKEVIDRITSFGTELNDEDQILLKQYTDLLSINTQIAQEERTKVVELGGLHIVGSERHESRRIDNQLRGRAGRQGDPGSTIFFISLDDDLPQRFGEDRMKRMMAFVFKGNEDLPIQGRMLTKFFENAQKRTEQFFFAARRNVLEYDDVLNKQRNIIYGERNKVLGGEDVHSQIVEMIKEIVQDACLKTIDETLPYYDWDLEEINKSLALEYIIPKDVNVVTKELIEGCDELKVTDKVYKLVIDNYERKISELAKINLDFRELERQILLKAVDKHWMDHIDEMNTLRNEIFTQAYGQRDPINMYKKESFDMFDKMIEHIRKDVPTALLNTRVEINIEKPTVDLSKGEHLVHSGGTYVADKTTNRNEPCPCGSGKKYKNCCMKSE